MISRFASIGEDCRIDQNVTIVKVNREAQQIGNQCLIGAGAVTIGDIKYVNAGARAVVNCDILDCCTVVAGPLRVVKREAL